MSAEALGWLAQACFALRVALQWHASEHAGRSVAPRSFWWLSLAGALGMALYTLDARQHILAGGYVASAWIYVRNLRLEVGGRDRSRTRLWPEAAVIGVILGTSWLAGSADAVAAGMPLGWLLLLLTGQLLWSGRFALQWLASERHGRSILPSSFWWVSLAGNTLLLTYALHLGDPILIMGLAFGPLAQIRNLVFARTSAGELSR